jgi:hypothetical protein
MNRLLGFIATFCLVICASRAAQAVILIGGSLNNGDLDQVVSTEINPPAPGFFLPKPTVWQNFGSRTNTGPYEDEPSSENFAGVAPTPVTTNGNGLPTPNGCDRGTDCGYFYKGFSGNLTTGDLATGHLYQDVAGSPGKTYSLSGWAGAEANYSGLIPATVTKSQFAIDFDNDQNIANGIISSAVLDLAAAGLGVPNGQPFNYKKYTVSGVAPAGTLFVRARASMIDGYGNPAGGSQAFVIDDFTLALIPEPATITISTIALLALLGFTRRR